MSQIYSYVKYSFCNHLKRVLYSTSQPFFTKIRDWVIYGELNTNNEDFFVKVVKNINNPDDIWSEKYVFNYCNIPNFFDKDFYYKIFNIGKIIHFIKNYCRLPHFSLNDETINNKLFYYVDQEDVCLSKENIKEQVKNDNLSKSFNNNDLIKNNEKFKRNLILIFSKEPLNVLTDISQLKKEIDIIYIEINKFLVDIFYNKFDLFEHLKTINNYLLLGQGDMIQYLMDLIASELNKPSSQIQKYNLRNSLDTAISASNAQFQKYRYNIDVKLIESSYGDLGWDIFTLEYNVEMPLNIIFNKINFKEYQRLFNFFWELKRLEFNNHDIWKKFISQSHIQRKEFDYFYYKISSNDDYLYNKDNIDYSNIDKFSFKPYIHRAMIFNQHIIQFVTTIHNYISQEVLETQSKNLILRLKSVNKIDDIIDLHNKFIKKVVQQSLLNDENAVVYKTLKCVFDIIIRYKSAMDILLSNIIETYTKIKTYNCVDNKYGCLINNLTEEDVCYIKDNNKFLKQSFNNTKDLFESFKTQVSSLIKTLEVIGNGNFKFLAMKLDYNYYYSNLELKNYNNTIDNNNNNLSNPYYSNLKNKVSEYKVKDDNNPYVKNLYRNYNDNYNNEQNSNYKNNNIEIDDDIKSNNMSYQSYVNDSNNNLNKENINELEIENKSYSKYINDNSYSKFSKDIENTDLNKEIYNIKNKINSKNKKTCKIITNNDNNTYNEYFEESNITNNLNLNEEFNQDLPDNSNKYNYDNNINNSFKNNQVSLNSKIQYNNDS